MLKICYNIIKGLKDENNTNDNNADIIYSVWRG